MKKPGGKKDKSQGKMVYPIELRSLNDLIMNVTAFDGPRPIFAFRDGNSYTLYAHSAKLGQQHIVLYVKQEKIGKYVLFRPHTAMDTGTCVFVDSATAKTHLPNTYLFPVIELGKPPYIMKQGKANVNLIEIVGFDRLLKGIMLQHQEGGLGKVFAFDYKGNKYISTFKLIDDDETKTLAYAKASLDKDYSFFRYNYTEDKIEPTHVFGEPSYLYVRIIHLKEAFPFFKPE